MQMIDGGVTAPQGFIANGVLSGIKAGRTKEDTALIFSEKVCNAAGVFTQNVVKIFQKVLKNPLTNYLKYDIIIM